MMMAYVVVVRQKTSAIEWGLIAGHARVPLLVDMLVTTRYINIHKTWMSITLKDYAAETPFCVKPMTDLGVLAFIDFRLLEAVKAYINHVFLLFTARQRQDSYSSSTVHNVPIDNSQLYTLCNYFQV